MREAIILAGGFGTRLLPIVSDRPKPMAEINGIPFLELLIQYLSKNNFRRVILSLHHKYEFIVNYFREHNYPLDLIYCIDDKPLGTGGAIKQALKHSSIECVFVLNGDTFLNIDFNEIEKIYTIHQKQIIVSNYLMNTGRYGYFDVIDNKIIKFNVTGKNAFNYINLGAYLIKSNIFSDFHEEIFSFERDFLGIDKNATNFMLYEHNDVFIDIGIPSDYLKAQDYLSAFLNKK